MLTLGLFNQHLRQITQAKKFWIAFSGGLDSAVLMHLFYQLKLMDPNISLYAIHVNHGLSFLAEHWERHCQEICQTYDIPMTVRKVHISTSSSDSLEELARIERYCAFREALPPSETLVTAHHQCDQAETLLLQLFRGAGPKGLASMPSIMPLGQGLLIRPLLPFTREMLENYAKEHGIHWQEDISNGELNFNRNFIRHEIMPLLKNRWPSIVQNLARSAKHCAGADHYIDHHVAKLVQESNIIENQALSIPLLLKHDSETQAYIIRFWLQQLNLPLPSTQKLHLLQHQILLCRHDAMPLLEWKHVNIRRYNHFLYAMPPLSPHDPSMVLKWDLRGDFVLPNQLGTITLKALEQLGFDIDKMPELTVRFRQGGERCTLKNRQHTHSLKKLFQEWRVPPWLRDRVPLLYSKDQLVAIFNYAACR